MKKEERFEALKEEILRRARKASACAPEYGRAYKAESLSELMTVIKDNFSWCCYNGVIDSQLITDYEQEFESNGIYSNKSISSGYCLASDNTTVEAWGNATVRAWGNATVRAWGNATVRAWGNATVEASDNATVEASGNAYCTSFYLIECKLSGSALYRVRYTNTVYFASDDINFLKQ